MQSTAKQLYKAQHSLRTDIKLTKLILNSLNPRGWSTMPAEDVCVSALLPRPSIDFGQAHATLMPLLTLSN